MIISQQHLKTAAIILLAVCSVVFFNGYPRYQAMGAELLANADFRDGLTNWSGSNFGVEVLSAEGSVKLQSDNASQSVTVSQIVSANFPGSLLQLSCDIKTNRVKSGERGWETARVALFSINAEGKALYHIPHLLIKQDGSHDWLHGEKVFEIGADVSKVELALQLARSSGELWVKNVSLRPVMLKSAFKDYRLQLLSVWLLMAIWVILPLLRSGFKSWAHMAVLTLTMGIFIGVLMPENLKETLAESLWSGTVPNEVSFSYSQANDAQTFRFTPQLPNLDFFKIGHFVMFALLAITLLVGRPFRVSTARLLFYLWLMAMVSEVLQLFMPGRSAQVGDIAIDCSGVLTGLAMTGLYQWLNKSGSFASRRL